MTALSRLSSAHLLAAMLLLGTSAGGAAGAPKMRYQVDQRGDVVLFGNTVGWDCDASVLRPVVGAAPSTCAHQDGTTLDLLWQSDAQSASAGPGVKPADAGSTAFLDPSMLPGNAKIAYARLYWAAGLDAGVQPGMTVMLERPSKFSQAVTADDMVLLAGQGPGSLYQATTDITGLVQQYGPGPYRVSGISAAGPRMLLKPNFIFWTVVLFYDKADEPPRTLMIMDDLELVTAAGELMVPLGNFVASSDKGAKVGIITYGASNAIPGDSLKLNGMALSDQLNPATNFFNSTRSVLGMPVSVVGDLPQLMGTAGSMVGLDMDVVAIPDALIKAMSTTATLAVSAAGDVIYTGVIIGSIPTLKPVFTDSTLTYTPQGAIYPGDTVEYTLVVKNTGNDDSNAITFEDMLPQGVAYVMGSLKVDGQAMAYNGTGPITAPLAPLDPNQVPTIKYQVRVDVGTTPGTMISNQATITATGKTGSQSAMWRSGNGTFPNRATTFTVQTPPCQTNADCPAEKPLCKDKQCMFIKGHGKGSGCGIRPGPAGLSLWPILGAAALLIQTWRRRPKG